MLEGESDLQSLLAMIVNESIRKVPDFVDVSVSEQTKMK